jgi:DNA (cytosine-5)-methyltransferase 1
MMSQPLVLSCFPGIGLLDRAFEEEGFCVVRGPDLLWGGDIRTFHPPAGRFEGVIGGPPCQSFSPIGNVNKARWGEDSVMQDMIPEFARVISEARPAWWVMENSPRAYAPFPAAHRVDLDTAWLGEAQRRRRAFWSNLRLHLDVPALVGVLAGSERTVCSKTVDNNGSRAREGERSLSEMLELQGAPAALFEHSPFTLQAKRKMVGNGVPLPMGRAVARAVKKAMGYEMSLALTHESEPVSRA